MSASKAARLVGLLVLVIFISLYSSAEAEFIPPPLLSESEKAQFGEWLEVAKDKSEDKVFSKEKGKYLNALVNSSSPYLRQHAKNPVNWKPWRNQYLASAEAENKLIFLSIGYSTCHWCHVMAKESFSDVDVAIAVNDSYVAIKVDREELPQIDSHYASLLEAVTGSAGWPITAIINSEGLPIYIGSYVSKENLVTLLQRVGFAWENNPEFLLTTARNISRLTAVSEGEDNNNVHVDTAELLTSSKKKVVDALDTEFGGLNGAVKFPQESLLLYLLDELRRTLDPDLAKLVSLQLTKMMNGGIRDHVDGGFHRYSTDSQWSVPHYEKMLYNQALMAQVYLEAWQGFREDSYRFVAKETLDFAIECLYQEGRGFYSALDADFNGEEGGFYLWSGADVADALKIEGISSYSVEAGEKRSSRTLGILSDIALKNAEMLDVLKTLQEQRHSRGSLHRDDKVIASWNGLMIYSLAMASRALDNKEYISIAEKVGELMWASRFDDRTGKLFRTSDRRQELFSLEDYAYLSRGFVGLYDVTRNPTWLERAKTIYQSANANAALPQSAIPSQLGSNASFSLMDGELISPKVVFQEVELALKRRTFDPKLFKIDPEGLDQAKARVAESAINRFSSLRYLNNELNGSSESIRYFANGVGRLSIVCTKTLAEVCVSIELQFSLKEGWHINSNEPLQDYLVPTIVKSTSELLVEYPRRNVLRLGFQDEPLSLFDGEFKILISKKPDEVIRRTKISVPLQACNDELCLLPQESFIIF
ncbi:thioredoxin domain-containing protein [Gilvimarinus japonicus]|uniref:Thioredoxin domain-containing protein n=1 Tax=Gilvimarinus japonicus TaxID=1796469 RepID=A0ABV7HVC7_9GAMM